MEKRIFKRIYANIHARYFFDDIMYTGTITNLSENGMFIIINTDLYYFKSRFNVELLIVNGSLDIPVMLSRFVETDGFYHSMGVEVVDPPKQYLEFVTSLKSSHNSAYSNYYP